MNLSRRRFLESAIGIVTVGLAGCSGGGGGGGGGGTPTPTFSPTPTSTPVPRFTTVAQGPDVQVVSHPELGDILADRKGQTVYMYEKDTQGETTSKCTGDCADMWPKVTVKTQAQAVEVGPNVKAETNSYALFATGGNQSHVMVNGWPIYIYKKDEKPGDAKGQGVNGHYVLDPSGKPIKS
ncbi:MAG: hypothetical protein SVG88_13225 [Halobacteriales archaeon]|nr:hypothetical protein [Halobacteriales archaeon]